MVSVSPPLLANGANCELNDASTASVVTPAPSHAPLVLTL
jgi:hypothetical protein